MHHNELYDVEICSWSRNFLVLDWTSFSAWEALVIFICSARKLDLHRFDALNLIAMKRYFFFKICLITAPFTFIIANLLYDSSSNSLARFLYILMCLLFINLSKFSLIIEFLMHLVFVLFYLFLDWFRFNMKRKLDLATIYFLFLSYFCFLKFPNNLFPSLYLLFFPNT